MSKRKANFDVVADMRLLELARGGIATATPPASTRARRSKPRKKPVAQPPAPEPQAPAREGVVLYGCIEPANVAFFERVFERAQQPSLLDHCIFASVLACTQTAQFAGVAGLQSHLQAQLQLLHRIALHKKLGKHEAISGYAGTLAEGTGRLDRAPIAHPPALGDAVVLYTELSDPALGVINNIVQDAERWDFVRARQLTLSLQAQHVLGFDESKATALHGALRTYAQRSATALHKLFVRVRVERTTSAVIVPEPALDEAARLVLAALRS